MTWRRCLIYSDCHIRHYCCELKQMSDLLWLLCRVLLLWEDQAAWFTVTGHGGQKKMNTDKEINDCGPLSHLVGMIAVIWCVSWIMWLIDLEWQLGEYSGCWLPGTYLTLGHLPLCWLHGHISGVFQGNDILIHGSRKLHEWLLFHSFDIL